MCTGQSCVLTNSGRVWGPLPLTKGKLHCSNSELVFETVDSLRFALYMPGNAMNA